MAFGDATKLLGKTASTSFEAIDFPQFVGKLVTETFEGITNAQMEQFKTVVDLLKTIRNKPEIANKITDRQVRLALLQRGETPTADKIATFKSEFVNQAVEAAALLLSLNAPLLLVNNGKINADFDFNIIATDQQQKTRTEYDREYKRGGISGSANFLTRVLGIGLRGYYNSSTLSVTSSKDVTSSDIVTQISTSAHIEMNFSSSRQPLPESQLQLLEAVLLGLDSERDPVVVPQFDPSVVAQGESTFIRGAFLKFATVTENPNPALFNDPVVTTSGDSIEFPVKADAAEGLAAALTLKIEKLGRTIPDIIIPENRLKIVASAA